MKIICIGRNYLKHVEEMKQQVPGDPLFFMKPETALIKPGFPFFYPEFSSNVHYEVELVLRIHRLGKNIHPRFAHKYYKEVAVGIDFTARDLQQQAIQNGQPWEPAKAFDGSALISTFVSIGNLSNPEDIRFSLKKNGKTVQKSSSQYMIRTFDQLIGHVSQYVTLKIGDLLFTGTPEGVGPVQPGDHLELFLEDTQMVSLNIK